jgi:nitric oxide reductase NorD protein
MKQTRQKLPLSAEEMEERLDEHVGAVLSSRCTAEQPAMELARLRREQQEFVLHWVAATAQTHAEMAYQFAALTRTAMDHMDTAGVEAWIIQAMDAFDKKGLGTGITQLQKVEEFAQGRQQRTTGLALEDISGVLQHFIRGLNGRHLYLDAGEQTYTDTQTLIIPALINRFATREENFRLYKAIVSHLGMRTK